MTGDSAEIGDLLRDSARALLAAHTGSERAARVRLQGNADPAMWARFAEQGWLVARLPEELGGLGLGTAELAVIAAELGAAGASDPLVMGGFLPGALLARLPAEATPWAELLQGEPLAVALSAWPLVPENGTLTFDLLDHGSTVLLAVAGEAGTELRAVERAALSVTLKRDLPDGTRRLTATVSTAIVAAAPLLGKGEPVGEAWMMARVEAGLLLAHQQMGAARAIFETTLEHCRDRVQFGKPIAEFQAVRHKLADLAIALELGGAALARAMRDLAGYHGAMPRVADTAMTMARAGIQLHGALGFTEESRISGHIRLAMTLGPIMGTPAYHRAIVWQRFREARHAAG